MLPVVRAAHSFNLKNKKNKNNILVEFELPNQSECLLLTVEIPCAVQGSLSAVPVPEVIVGDGLAEEEGERALAGHRHAAGAEGGGEGGRKEGELQEGKVAEQFLL